MGLKIKLRTNLMCEGCKARITPFLDQEEKIENWNLDLNDENKVLYVEGEEISVEEVIKLISKAGYQAFLDE